MLCWICNYSPNCSEGHFVSLDMSHSLTSLAVATHLPSVQNDPSLGNSHCISFMFASSSEAKVIRRIGNCSGSISVHVHINSQQLAHHFINHSWCRIFTTKNVGCCEIQECYALWSAGMRDSLPSYIRSPGSEGMIESRCSQSVRNVRQSHERLRSTSLPIWEKIHSHRAAKPAKQHMWNSQRAKCYSP